MQHQLIPNSIALLLWVFLALDPVKKSNMACTTSTDASCLAVIESQNPSAGICQLQPDQWVWTSPHASVVSEFNLVCDRGYLVQLANSITFLGSFFGSGIFGFLCDKLGRKTPLFAATALVAVATFTSLAAPNYAALVICRALAGAGAAGVGIAVFLIATESVGPHWRGRASIASSVVFIIGELALVGMAAAIKTWRGITIASGIASAAMLLLYPFIEESPRWLLSIGQHEKAVRLLQAISASNRTTMPMEPLISSTPSSFTPNSLAEVKNSSGSSSSFSHKGSSSTQQVRLRDMLRQPQTLFHFCMLALVWFTSIGTWYGISLGAGTIPGSM